MARDCECRTMILGDIINDRNTTFQNQIDRKALKKPHTIALHQLLTKRLQKLFKW